MSKPSQTTLLDDQIDWFQVIAGKQCGYKLKERKRNVEIRELLILELSVSAIFRSLISDL